MSERIVECVPNFSEGRDEAVIEAIAAAVRGTPHCTLLGVDPGRSTNRTVVTFVGPPRNTLESTGPSPKVSGWPRPSETRSTSSCRLPRPSCPSSPSRVSSVISVPRATVATGSSPGNQRL